MGDSTVGYPEPPGYTADVPFNPQTVGEPRPLRDFAQPGGVEPPAITGGRMDAREPKRELRMSKRFTMTQGTQFGDDLGFNARSVIVDNNTGQWLYDAASRRYVPPACFGAVLQFPSGSQIGTVSWTPPPGVTQPAGLAGSQAVLIYTEDLLDPSAGIISAAGTGQPGGTANIVRIEDGATTALATVAALHTGDAQAVPSGNGLLTDNLQLVLNGAGTLDRLRAANSDAQAATGLQGAGSMVFNGATWDRVRDVGIGDAAAVTGVQAAGEMLFNGATYDRARTAGIGDAAASTGIQAATDYVYNGATFDRPHSASAANLAGKSGQGVVQVTGPGVTVTTSNPAAGTAASASVAAGGAGVRNVCKAVTFILSATTALAGITTVTVNLRDGASGAGTILATWQVTLPASTLLPTTLVNLTGLDIPGSAATAMTLEGSAAVGNLMQSANLITYTAS